MKRSPVPLLGLIAIAIALGLKFLPSGAPVSQPVTLDQAAIEQRRALDLSLGDPTLEAQIRVVVQSFDRTGSPPEGVTQGGRGGGMRGLFENVEGKLPRRPPGYYHESDVWPRDAEGRGAQRLVFGAEREVYYSADHYRTFARIR